MTLLATYRRTGRSPTLAEKFQHENDLNVLEEMRAACGARGRILTEEEESAFALRRAELQRGQK